MSDTTGGRLPVRRATMTWTEARRVERGTVCTCVDGQVGVVTQVNERDETVSVQVDGERRHIAHEQLSLDGEGALVERA